MRTATCGGCDRFIYYGQKGGNRGWLHGEPGDSWWNCNEGGEAYPAEVHHHGSSVNTSRTTPVNIDEAASTMNEA